MTLKERIDTAYTGAGLIKEAESKVGALRKTMNFFRGKPLAMPALPKTKVPYSTASKAVIPTFNPRNPPMRNVTQFSKAITVPTKVPVQATNVPKLAIPTTSKATPPPLPIAPKQIPNPEKLEIIPASVRSQEAVVDQVQAAKKVADPSAAKSVDEVKAAEGDSEAAAQGILDGIKGKWRGLSDAQRNWAKGTGAVAGGYGLYNYGNGRGQEQGFNAAAQDAEQMLANQQAIYQRQMSEVGNRGLWDRITNSGF